MIKTMIVDDEPFIRQGLRILIDWESEGCSIVREASNGKEALSLFEKEEIDLIITDIKMPEMNGLELLSNIRNLKNSNAYFIILSGFSDFEYAKKAIHYRCVDYILKPVNKDELINAIRKIRLQSKKNSEEILKMKQGEKAIFDNSIISLLYGNNETDNLQSIFNFAKFSTDTIHYVTMEVGLEDYDLIESEKRKIQRKMYEECRNQLGEMADTHIIYDAIKEKNCYDIGIIYESNMGEKSKLTNMEFLLKIKNIISSKISYPIFMYVGRSVKGIDKISKSYKDTTIMRAMQLFKNNKSITYYEQEIKLIAGKSIDKNSLDELVSAIDENDKHKIDKITEKFFQYIFYHSMDSRIINLNIDYILYRLLHVAISYDDNLNQEDVLKHISLEVFERKEFDRSEEWFKEFAYSFAYYLNQLRNNIPKGILLDIENDVKQNYMKNISLRLFSEKYFINSAYLGQLFKKQFGKSFKEYLTEIRVERASEMLIRTDDKIYIIAEKVGYQNYEYFVNKFVSLKGCTPTKYRKSKLKCQQLN